MSEDDAVTRPDRQEVTVQRWVIFGLVMSTTAFALVRLWAVFRVDGISVMEMVLLATFALLFSWITASFWVACLGAHTLWRGTAALPLQAAAETGSESPRSALVMPIYNEDSTQVCARLQAILDSVRAAGALARFDLYMLSDSTNSEARAAEWAGWRRLRAANPDARVYYRRRDDNVGRKSGNIADFCVNWGALYDYMMVLDADSLITGATLARLVRVMDANPRTALIQVAPLLVGGQSLFARSQQFASWVYGPIYAAGLARLQGADGNYWGHNAMIRIRPFMQHCGLPVLPGRRPFGGEIMSHDFVEAALLRRAGWDVWMAPDFGGSFEVPPPTLVDHLKRDRRWCQGNLQHVGLLLTRGFRLQSRIHMAFGAMSYLSSPFWLMLIIFFSADAVRLEQVAPVTYVGRYPVLAWPISHTVTFISLAAATAGLLYGPKLLALLLVLRDKDTAQAFGGTRSLVMGVILESVLSTLLAPVFMLSHSWFVATALIGHSTGWGVQRRDADAMSFGTAVLAFGPHTLIGIVAGILAWYWTPGSFWWYLPLFLGLVVAIPLCWMTSDPARGAAARWRGLFVVPSESIGLPIVDRVDALLRQAGAAPGLADPVPANGRLQPT